MEDRMQMQGGWGVEAVQIIGWLMRRIRLRHASKVVHKHSGKYMLRCWPPLARWEGRIKSGECFEVSSQLEIGRKNRWGPSSKLYRFYHPSWMILTWILDQYHLLLYNP
jgi:hypothetical protein